MNIDLAVEEKTKRALPIQTQGSERRAVAR